MAALDIDRYLEQLKYQKRKYHAKVMSENALRIGWYRMIDTENWFSYECWMDMLFYIHLDISSLFIFGLSPEELEPWNLEFKMRLPDLEEFLEGIKIVFERTDIGQAWKDFMQEYFNIDVPPVHDYDTFVSWNVEPEIQRTVAKQKERKFIIGVTKYGEGYVDPPTVREFLRASFLELLRRRPDLERFRAFLEQTAKSLDIAEHIAESVYNRIAMLYSIIHENFILGYNLLGVSKLTPRGSQRATCAIKTWRREVFDVHYERFIQPQAGFILGVTPLGFGLLIPRRRFYKPNPKTYPKDGAPPCVFFIDWKARRNISRYIATPLAVANYAKPEEMRDVHKCERVMQYAELQTLRYVVDSIVTSVFTGVKIDAFRLNLYRRAANQLIGHRKKRHRWGYGAWKTMTEEEFKEWWLSYWEKQGLDRTHLQRIYEAVERWLNPARQKALELGERLSKVRRRLAQLRKA
ncbi:MAG: hypothetical protein DRI26_00200 [Chloroflexi bacterium]|nr:MAG: hypothetical protein DRI26_00200 [Chloroflexota bacterium]